MEGRARVRVRAGVKVRVAAPLSEKRASLAIIAPSLVWKLSATCAGWGKGVGVGLGLGVGSGFGVGFRGRVGG